MGSEDRAGADDDDLNFIAAIDWTNTSGVLIIVSLSVAIVAIIALCAICMCRSRRQKNKLKGAIGTRRSGVHPKYTHSNIPSISNPSIIIPNTGNITNPVKVYESQVSG